MGKGSVANFHLLKGEDLIKANKILGRKTEEEKPKEEKPKKENKK